MSTAIIIPTFRRPDGLMAALESALAQSRPADEIIVVDNSPEGGAREAVEALDAPAVRYVHEAEPGVANARNTALAATDCRYIAFLDDDEIAQPTWLEALKVTAERLDAQVVFGPLQAQALRASGLRLHLLNRLYSREGAASDELLGKPFGCGNSLVDRAAFDLPPTPFPRHLNETGGEDDMFFAMLEQQGARFAWSAGAGAIECVDPSRANWRYLLSRSFSFGQGPSQHCANKARPDWAGVAKWMLVGLAQFAIFAPLAAVTSLFSPRLSAGFIDKSAQAAGKIFWQDRFAPRFYGSSALG